MRPHRRGPTARNRGREQDRHAGAALFACALLGVGVLPAFGCRGRNLIGGSGDGGPPDGPGADVVVPRDDASSAPVGDAALSDTANPDTATPDTATPDASPEVVDPEISRAWTWQPCGTIASEPPDTAAVFDPQGNIAVLGSRAVRLYDASGDLLPASSGPASFLINAPDGAPLAGTFTSSAIVMTPIGAVAPRFIFALPKPSTCAKVIAFSSRGDYLLAHGAGSACVWRTSDGALVGNVGNIATTSDQVAIRGDKLVSMEGGAQTTEVVTRDFTGLELGRLHLAVTSGSYLSPSGDRLVWGGALWDLDTGQTIPLSPEPSGVSGVPTFTSAGDLVLLGGGVFRTSDGLRQQTSRPGSRIFEGFEPEVALSPDGLRIVSLENGRASLLDITGGGITAVLGPPVSPGAASSPNALVSQLALSADGSLLASNVPSFGAFGIKLAPSFGASKVIWNIDVSVNLVVDLSQDNQLVAIGGDGRSIFSAVDGRTFWPGQPPSPSIAPDTCLPERLRFSPKRTWVAGSDYDRMVDVFAVGDGTSGTEWKPVVQLPAGCDAVVFSRDERLMATSGAALYQTAPTADGWRKLWATDAPAPPADSIGPTAWANDVSFSPDETVVMASWCRQDNVCTVNLLSSQTGASLRTVTDLKAPHPSFSPDGSWIVAGGTLVHLASGDVRILDPVAKTTIALFTPEGDIIAASADYALTRYCRSP